MSRWFKQIAALLIFTLALGACSRVGLAYRNLDVIIPWSLSDYVDMNGEQKDWFNERLKEHQRESSKCHRLKHALRTNPDFKLDTVAIVGPHQVHAVEKIAIALEDSTGPNGLNITIGGAGVKKPDEKYETYKMHVHDIYHRMKRGSFVSYDVLFMKNDTMLSEEEFQAIRRLL